MMGGFWQIKIKMIINDRVYGNLKINDKVIVELINSKPVQRLKGISQYGPNSIVLTHLNTTRFEHSVGVYLLLKKLNAAIEEQIAGLLHDIGHTAFSHVIDFMFKNHEQTYHEKFYHEVFSNSKIPLILKKHSLDINHIINEKNHSLLEKDLPDLCADRLDYSYRDLTIIKHINIDDADKNISNLIIKNNEIVFDDIDAARFFAFNYIEGNKILWAEPKIMLFMTIMSEIIDISLKDNFIKEEDLFLTDNDLLNKLRNTDSKEINEKFKLIRDNIKIKENKTDYDYHLKTKARIVDPKILMGNKIKRLSEIDNDYKKEIIKAKEMFDRGLFVKIVG